MNKLIETEIKNQAKQNIPHECCGFIIVNHTGKISRIYPTKNIAENTQDNFVIDPAEYIEAEREGKVIAYYHSHTLSDEQFSNADKVNSESLKLPLFVYSTITDKFNFYTPSNYEAPLIGREFVWGIFDCWALVVDYYKSKLNIKLDNHFFRKGHDDVLQNDYFKNNYESQHLIPHNEKLKEHDILFMKVESKTINHVAIYIGNDIILHHPGGRLSQRTFYGSYWKKVTAMKLRHKDLI